MPFGDWSASSTSCTGLGGRGEAMPRKALDVRHKAPPGPPPPPHRAEDMAPARGQGRRARQPHGAPMIIELGHFALTLALAAALVQTVLPAWGARVRDERLMAVAEPAALVQLSLVLFAFLALMHAYVTSDFSVETVWANSHSAKPLIYKISGVWGNHEGSMLLWVLILAVFGAAVALFGTNLPATLRANV